MKLLRKLNFAIYLAMLTIPCSQAAAEDADPTINTFYTFDLVNVNTEDGQDNVSTEARFIITCHQSVDDYSGPFSRHNNYWTAIRVPKDWGSPNPTAETTTGTALFVDNILIEFATSSTISARAEALYPSGSEEQWFGFITSNEFSISTAATSSTTFTVSFDWILPTTANTSATGAVWFSDDKEDRLTTAVVTAAYKTFTFGSVPLAITTGLENSEYRFNPVKSAKIYPNPVVKDGTIEFGLRSPGIVNIGIFDARGQLVQTLLNEYQEVGVFTIPFDATGLSPGIYTYRISADGKSIAGNFLVHR